MKFDKEKPINKKIPIIIGIISVVIIVGIIILKVAGIFPFKKDDEFITAPESYEFGETKVPAFTVEEDTKVKQILPEEENKGEDEKSEQETDSNNQTDDTQETATIIKTYQYTQIPDLSTKISDYCNSLISKDIGFTPIDDTNTKTELPSFDTPNGNVHLVLPANDENNSMYSINLTWDTENLTVVLSQKEGSIQTEDQSSSMSLDEVVSYLYTLHPSVFNLNGETMQEYLILTLDGIVLVDKTPCIRINIYQLDEVTQTNKIAGKYLFSSTNNDLYQLNPDNSIKQLNLS